MGALRRSRLRPRVQSSHLRRADALRRASDACGSETPTLVLARLLLKDHRSVFEFSTAAGTTTSRARSMAAARSCTTCRYSLTNASRAASAGRTKWPLAAALACRRAERLSVKAAAVGAPTSRAQCALLWRTSRTPIPTGTRRAGRTTLSSSLANGRRASCPPTYAAQIFSNPDPCLLAVIKDQRSRPRAPQVRARAIIIGHWGDVDCMSAGKDVRRLFSSPRPLG